MSVYWSRKSTNRELEARGLFDADSEIVVLWTRNKPIDPRVTVEHELSHSNMLQGSGLGYVERALTMWHSVLPALAYQRDDQVADLQTLPLARLEALRGASEEVHEAVAWFGTEELTAGRESEQSPLEYRKSIDLLRVALQHMRMLPPRESPEYFAKASEVAETLAILALSPVRSRELLLECTKPLDDRSANRRVNAMLAARDVDPTRRFQRLCREVRGVSPGELQAIERAVRNGVDGRPVRVGSIEVANPAETANTVATALDELAGRVGLTEPDGRARWEGRWQRYRARWGIDNRVDRYAQVAVVGDGFLGAAPIETWNSGRTDEPPADLLLSSAIMVTAAPETPNQRYGYRMPVHDPERIGALGVRLSSHFSFLEDVPNAVVAWETTQRKLRRHLSDIVVPAGVPVLVAEPGYDYAEGDLRGAMLLRDIPHVVVRVSSFWRWWREICESDSGLAGSRSIEWLPMPSARDPEGFFGYLVTKPAERLWPIVLHTVCITQYERALSIAYATQDQAGLTFNQAQVPPAEWLGPLMKWPSAAAQVHEAVNVH